MLSSILLLVQAARSNHSARQASSSSSSLSSMNVIIIAVAAVVVLLAVVVVIVVLRANSARASRVTNLSAPFSNPTFDPSGTGVRPCCAPVGCAVCVCMSACLCVRMPLCMRLCFCVQLLTVPFWPIVLLLSLSLFVIVFSDHDQHGRVYEGACWTESPASGASSVLLCKHLSPLPLCKTTAG